MKTKLMFKRGDLVTYGGKEYIFYCYASSEDKEKDILSLSGDYAYLDSVNNEESDSYDERPSQNNKRLWCADVSSIRKKALRINHP